MVDLRSVDEIFEAARCLPAGEKRAAYLEAACGGDAKLRKRVERLLAAHSAVGSFLDRPLDLSSEAVANSEPPETRLGSMVGQFKLVELIGEGGFGLVFVAEQQQPVHRLVALKVIKPGMDTREVLARFDAERQALALMDHPNIARVFEGGETESGRPYFVMELVRGVPITEYCDNSRLNIRQRVTLFVSVCQAVQHAHQKGVIHRDLKPTNILVATHDGAAEVKVIDFGIAKAISGPLTGKTLQTNVAQLIGTPSYMSPEQAHIGGADVDTRSDIYSLGVLLYELLTGTTPFDRERMRTADYDEIRRIIREVEPEKPSTRMSTLGHASNTISAQRQGEPKHLSQMIRGELDWIVMKALDKDRERRYESSSALAADLQRYLADQPVLAGPPSAGYRFRKYARRHKAVLVTTAVVAAALVAGAGLATWQAVVATRAAAGEKKAKEIAELRETETRAVLDFVQSKVFAAARPKRQQGGIGREVTLREAIKAAVPFVDKSFANEPLIEAKLRITLGQSFYLLGEMAAADEQYQKARATYVKLLGDEHPNTLWSMVLVANSQDALGHGAEALRLRQQTLDLQTRVLGPDHPDTLMTMHNLSNSLADAGKHSEALQLMQTTLTRRQHVLGAEHDNTLQSQSGLSMRYHTLGRFEEALTIRQWLYQLRRERLGPDHPETLLIMGNLANTLMHLDRPAEALQLHEEALALKKETLGPDHPDTLLSMTNLANCHSALKQHDEALRIREEALKLQQQVQGPNHPETLRCMNNLAASYHNVRRYDDALALRRETLELRKAKLGPDHPDTLNTMKSVADSLLVLNKGAEAVLVMDECLRLAARRTDLPRLVSGLMNTRLRHFEKAKDVEGCRVTAEMWERLGRTDAESLFVAGRLWGVTARISRGSDDADRAMSWLLKAAAAGYRDNERLDKSTDFDALRDRPDFKTLLSGVKAERPEG